jgi:hypothetical protein
LPFLKHSDVRSLQTMVKASVVIGAYTIVRRKRISRG